MEGSLGPNVSLSRVLGAGFLPGQPSVDLAPRRWQCCTASGSLRLQTHFSEALEATRLDLTPPGLEAKIHGPLKELCVQSNSEQSLCFRDWQPQPLDPR